jgi:ribosomal protein S27E
MIKIIFKCDNCSNETGTTSNPAYYLGSAVYVTCDKCGNREPIQREVTKS